VALSKQAGMLLIFTHTVHATLLKAGRGKIPRICFSLMFLIATKENKDDVIPFLRSEGVRQDTVNTFTVQNFCRQHINFTVEEEEKDIPSDLKKQS
jgi:hypothetical protein